MFGRSILWSKTNGPTGDIRCTLSRTWNIKIKEKPNGRSVLSGMDVNKVKALGYKTQYTLININDEYGSPSRDRILSCHKVREDDKGCVNISDGRVYYWKNGNISEVCPYIGNKITEEDFNDIYSLCLSFVK